ncbi:serine hydrolase domain-containing protein [Aestuariibius sp. 2305UL40-4]|uniref:serine hydrolase domain-containing protein n=1 Tax=Aestuariibius violaceus TaxID=3234132 RepID=UPI00345E99CC
MKRFLKWAGVALIAITVPAAALAVWNREEIARLLAVNSLFDADRIVSNFSEMEELFLTRDMPLGEAPVLPLLEGPPLTPPDGYETWVQDRAVTSIVVLDQGQIVLEDYLLGTEPTDRRISWSVAKSYLSVLTGILLAEGAIDSIDDPVTNYVPELAGTAYDQATLRDLLTMSSGVVFDEDYLDPNSDINRMGRVLALGQSMDGFTSGLTESERAPGIRWNYVSIDTHVIGMVLRGATGREIPDLLAEKVLAPIGLEETPAYITDGHGVAFVLGGLLMTTRDYARFGRIIAQDGAGILPADWIKASTTPQANTMPGARQYGYQWWVPADAREGEAFAHGIYGQYIYIDRSRDIVIAMSAADRQFRWSNVQPGNIEMFRRISDTLMERR